jgi:hypothetical protein
MLELICGKCGERLQLSENMAGATLPCPRCAEKIAIPRVISGTQFQQNLGNGPTSGKAIASLVLGLCSFCFGITGIAAIILGSLAKKDIDRYNGHQKGIGMAVWGIVLGALGFILNLSYGIWLLCSETTSAKPFIYPLF